jgi:hypothetical protein
MPGVCILYSSVYVHVKFTSYYPPGAWNFEVATKYKEN